MRLKPIIILSTLIALVIGQDESWKLYDDSQVAEVYITVDQEDLTWMYNNVHSDSLHPATIHFVNAWIDETVAPVGFRLRGNTSRDSQKKSFKVSFNEYVSGGEFYGVDKLNLNGEHNDPSIIRSKLCWDLFQDAGIAASRAAHARVYINGNYYGLYISVEHVDDEFLEKYFADDTGNLWKCLWPADLSYRGDNPADYWPYAGDERPYELKTNEDEYDFSGLAHLIDILNNTATTDLPDSLEKVLNVAEVLQYFAMNILTGSWDDYRYLKNNYYLYYEPAEDIFHFIPYDYDNTFGVDWFSTDWWTIDPYDYPRNDDGPRVLATRLLSNDQYRNLFTHFLKFYNDNVFELSLWEARIDTLKDRIASAAEADNYRTYDYGYSMDDFHNSYSQADYNDGNHLRIGLKEFVTQRHGSLPAQLEWLTARPIVYDIDWQPRNPGASDSIHFTVAAFSAVGVTDVTVQLSPGYLTVIEEYPMEYSPVTASKIVEEADRWTVTMPPLGYGGFGEVKILATDVNGQYQVYPRSTSIHLQAPDSTMAGVVVNEFLASNDGSCYDPAGEADDFLELYNPTTETMNLNGCYLSDKTDNLTKWQFPVSGVSIAPGGFLVVWCDEDEGQSGYHSNFKLSAGGEFIALLAADGVTVLDSLSFGEQTADVSWGRRPDGSSNWKELTPTPGSANITLEVDQPAIPVDWQVTAYPNPFNAQVQFQMHIPETGYLQMTVFDIRGRRVATLERQLVTAGVRSFDWRPLAADGHPLASGVLLVRSQLSATDGRIIARSSTKLLYLK